MSAIKGTLSLLAAFALLQADVSAEQKLGQFSIDDDGAIGVSGLKARTVHFDGNWVSTQTYKNSCVPLESPKKEKGVWSEKADFTVKNGKFALERKYTLGEDGSLLVEESVSSASPVKSNELALSVSLPLDSFAEAEIDLGGVKRKIPMEFEDKGALYNKDAYGAVVIPCQDFKLKIEGPGSVLMQDNRKFKGRDVSLRFRFDKSSGEISNAKLALKLTPIPYASAPLDISKAMNMGFADEVAGDGKGGWTDQGSENDLRMLKTGRAKFCGASFDIVNPAKNDGKSCVVLSGSRGGFPASASVAFPKALPPARALCLLNASAWTPPSGTQVGALKVLYADGSSSSFPMISGRNVGNWWAPVQLKDSRLAWTGENRSSFVGLHLSEFPLEAKPVSGLEFKAEGDSLWMIVAASVVDDQLPKRVSAPSYVVESKDWKPVEFDKAALLPGSALDFSNLLDAPAGKYGPVVMRNGHFELDKRPGEKLRLYGPNLCFTANYLGKDECAKLASLLARCGYNAVRFHHFDNQLVKKGQSTTTELDPVELDKLDFLFKSLKDKGLYITIDLFISRMVKPGEVPELKMTDKGDYKAAVFILDSAMKSMQEFSKNLLLHVNPYTGLAWKDDPALCFISLVNEDNIFSCWNKSPAVKALYEAKFKEWLDAKGLKPASDAERSKLMDAFLIETYDRAYAKMAAFVKSLGVRQPLSDQNMQTSVQLAEMRSHYDYVDNHFYWDHPHFVERPWNLPSAIKNVSAIKGMASCPSNVFVSRIFGKPFTITEFNWAMPCSYRSESGPLTGAYAALQGWDALFRFGWSHNDKTVVDDGRSAYFDVATDPINYLSDRIGVALFLRGDVAESKLELPVVVDPAKMDVKNFPKIATYMGLVGKVGSVVKRDGKAVLPKTAKSSIDANALESDASLLAGLKGKLDFGKGSLDLEKGVAKSSTGELELDSQALHFKAVTARSETFVLAAKGELSGERVKVSTKDAPATVFVSALDSKKLGESSRLLVLHLTDAMNNKIKFGDERHSLLESWGELPHLVKRGVASLSIKLEKGATPKVYAVDLAGRRIGETASTFDADGTLSFEADTFGSKTPCLAYEIVR